MIAKMRTTVTLDADVEQLLRDAMQRHRQSFKEALNQAIRSGLSNASAGPDETPFALRARRMGLRAGIDSARLNQVSDELEAAGFEELSRRLAKAHGKSPSRKRLTDAQIAAMALSHRAVVHTADRDFLRFPEVRCHFPLDE